MTTPSIYVADLAAYVAGRLHGEWIDCEDSAEVITGALKRIIATSPVPGAEELEIHDHEGWPCDPTELGLNPEKLTGAATAVAESDLPFEAVQAFVAHVGSRYFTENPADVVKEAEEAYVGCFRSYEEFGEEQAERFGEIPAFLTHYVDWERLGRDLADGDENFSDDSTGDVFVFRRN